MWGAPGLWGNPPAHSQLLDQNAWPLLEGRRGVPNSGWSSSGLACDGFGYFLA